MTEVQSRDLDPYITQTQLHLYDSYTDLQHILASSNNYTLSGYDDVIYDNENDAHFVHPEVVILAPFAILGFGAFLRHATKSLPLPYTMQLLIVGSLLGFLLRYYDSEPNHINTFQQSFKVLGNMDPHLMLHIFLPPLIFESAASLEWHLFSRAKWFIFTLAGPGLLLASSLTGMIINVLQDSSQFSEYYPDMMTDSQCTQNTWPPQAGLMLGVIMSATDPVAVVALLKDLGCKASLSTSIEGESLFNDGTALVMFTILVKIVEGDDTDTWGDYLWTFVKMTCGGALFGCAFALLIMKWLAFIFNDALAEITITVSAAYLCFFIAEYFFHVSGVIAVVCLGLLFGSMGRASVSPEVGHFLEEFWEMLAFFGNTLIFLVAGTVIGYKLPSVQVLEFGRLAILYLSCTLIRSFVIIITYLIFNYFGAELEKKDQLVAIWGGLRGAVGLSLAMMVFSNEKICFLIRDQVMFHTAGIVTLTVIINSSTMPKLVNFLGLDTVAPSKLLIYNQAMDSLLSAGEKQESCLRADHVFDSTVWEEARKYYFRVPKLNSSAQKVNSDLYNTILEAKEARRRVLMITKKSYWRQFQDGLLSNQTVQYLMHHTDLAIDDACCLNEWKIFSKLVRLNSTIINDDKAIEMKDMTSMERYRRKCLTMLNSIPAIVAILVLVLLSCALSFILDPVTTAFLVLEHTMTTLFLFELCVRIFCIGSWQSLLSDPYTLVDALVVFLDILLLGAGDILGSFSGYTKSFRTIRFLRLIRLLRVARLANKIQSTKMSVMNEPTSLWSKTESRVKNIRRRILFSQLKHGYEVANGFKIAREEVLIAFIGLMHSPNQHFTDIRRGIEKDLKDVRTALLDMQRLYSEIAASITTSIAARTVLNRQRKFTNQLFHEGLLEKIEYQKMTGAIEYHMKRLTNHPPIIAMPQKQDILGQIPWLECVGKEKLYEITSLFEDAVFQRGDVLIKQNESSDSVHVLARGTVVVQLETNKGEKIELDELGMGSVFGEIAWALRCKRGANIVATSPGLIFTIPGSILRNIASENQDLNDSLWETCGNRVSENLLSFHLQHKGISRREVRDIIQDMKIYNVNPVDKCVCFNTSGYVILLCGSGVQKNALTKKNNQIEGPRIIFSSETNCLFTVNFSTDAKFLCNPLTISKTKTIYKSMMKNDNTNITDLEYKRPGTIFTPLTANQYHENITKRQTNEERRSTISAYPSESCHELSRKSNSRSLIPEDKHTFGYEQGMKIQSCKQQQLNNMSFIEKEIKQKEEIV